jgi:hypothetical protein
MVASSSAAMVGAVDEPQQVPDQSPPQPEPTVTAKCRKVGQRFGSYCTGMREALKGQTQEGKGLAEMVGFVDGVDGARLLGIVYRVKAKTSGLILNVCPWCGETVKWWPEVAGTSEVRDG